MVQDKRKQQEESTPQKSGSSRVMMIGIWGAVLGLVALIAWGLINNAGTRPLVGDPSPNFTIHFYDGYAWADAADETIEMTDLRGKIVVLNFWASWCPPCHEEAADLERLWREYRDEDVVFLGIAYIDTEPNALEFLAQYDITYPNGPDIQSLITDEFLVKQVPETFVIDRDGEVVFIEPGPIVVSRLTAVLEELTAAPQAN